MAKIQEKCPTCGKIAIQQLDMLGMILLECGHLISEGQKLETVETSIYRDLVSQSGNRLREYQVGGCEFWDNANGRLLLDWEMGLGKMIASCAWIATHGVDCFPVVICAKASILLQWESKLIDWSDGREEFLPFIFRTGKDPVSKFFNIYLSTYDLIPKLLPALKKRGVKTLILDECQAIKNHNSKRTNSIRELSQDIPYVIGTSGSSILNNLLEFFPLFNILYPRQFPDRTRFAKEYTSTYWNSSNGREVIGGLSKFAEKRWQNVTSKFVTHLTRKEAAPDLPTVDRQFAVHELGEEVEKEYNIVQAAFRRKMEENDGDLDSAAWAHILAFIVKMRHIVGRVKGKAILEYLEEFLESSDTEKIVIFHHHQDVGETLEEDIKALLQARGKDEIVTRISSADSLEDREAKTKSFWENIKHRIYVCRLLAEGEGLNLQCASHAIIVERWWNAKKEEQAESRFTRIGSKAEKVIVHYPIIVGSLDEWNAEIVESKRLVVDAGLEGLSVESYESVHGLSNSNQGHPIKAIAEAMYNGTKTRWSLTKAFDKSASLIGGI